MGLYGSLGRLLGQSIRGGASAGQSASRRLADAANIRKLNRSSRSGVLAPGEPTPVSAAGDYIDLRGIAEPDTQPLPIGEFGLGQQVDVRSSKKRRRVIAAPISIGWEEINRHAVIVGPTGSGKTESILVPWIHAAMSTGASVIALDGQGGLADKIRTYVGVAGRTGARVSIWNYLDPSAGRSWNWIAELTTPERVDAAVVAILGEGPRSTGANVDPYHWDKDAEVLRSLLTFSATAATRAITANDLTAALRSKSLLSDRLYSRTSTPGATTLMSLVALDDEAFDRRVHGALTALAALATPGLTAATKAKEITLDSLMSESSLWIPVAPVQGGELSARVASLAIGLVLQRAAERYNNATRPLFVFIDETSLVANRVPLGMAVSQLRSAGVSVILGLQNVEQIVDENLRNTVLGNTATQVFFRGCSPKTLDYVEQRLGSRPESQTVVSRTASDATFSSSTGQVPVLGRRELANLWGPGRPALALLEHPGYPTKPVLLDVTRPDLV